MKQRMPAGRIETRRRQEKQLISVIPTVSRTRAAEPVSGSAVRIPVKRRTRASVTSDTASSPFIAKSQINRKTAPAPAETKAAIRLKAAASNSRMISADQARSAGDRKEGSRMPSSGIRRPAVSMKESRAWTRRARIFSLTASASFRW